MANLYSGTHSFTGYKTLAELSELTFTTDKKYTIQIAGTVYIREGTEGLGYICSKSEPFDWLCNGTDSLYIKIEGSQSIYINVSD